MTAPEPTLANVVEELRLLRECFGVARLLVNAAHAAEMCDMSENTFRGLVESEPGFPQPIGISTFSHARWRVRDLEKWVENRKQRR